MVSEDIAARIQRKLDLLKRRHEATYGIAVWDVHCREDEMKPGVLVSGHVLLGEQKRLVRQTVLAQLGGGKQYRFELDVLADAEAPRAAWGRPKAETVNVYSRPPEGVSPRSRQAGLLASQSEACDPPFRVLAGHRGWLLVQLYDLTLGWVRSELIETESADAAETWARLRRAEPGGLVSRLEGSAAVEQSGEYLGTTYLLGGTTKSGLDCSALVQRVYRRAFGAVLPKHSRDQMRVGKPIPFTRRKAGDLVFFGRGPRRGLHVGLLCDEQRLIHASSRRGSVRIDKVADLLSSLDLLQIRRVAGAESLS